MKNERNKLSTITCISLITFLFLSIVPPYRAMASDGRTGEDFSDLLFSSRDVLGSFDMTKASRMCGAREALNAVHVLFKTRATQLAGSDDDPTETRNWSSLSGTPTSITIDWSKFSERYSGGVIFVRSTIKNDCTGKSPRDLKWASVRFTIPVTISNNGDYRAGTPKNIHIDTICCGSQRITRTALFTPGGAIIRAEGTIYPPSKPKPKPVTTGSTGIGSTSTSMGSPPPTPRPKPTIKKPPVKKPKPKPWTEANPCPECEDEKAMVDHQKKRLAKFEKEKTRQETELGKVNGKIRDLEKDIKRLERWLKSRQNTGAESTDTTTGIRTSAYDQGDGTVVVKRIYPDGREEIVDTYTRRSSKDIKRDLEGKKQTLNRQKNTKKRLENRIRRLNNAINQAKKDLANSIEAFLACLEYCNRLIGISPPPEPVETTPDETAMPAPTGSPVESQDTTADTTSDSTIGTDATPVETDTKQPETDTITTETNTGVDTGTTDTPADTTDSGTGTDTGTSNAPTDTTNTSLGTETGTTNTDAPTDTTDQSTQTTVDAPMVEVGYKIELDWQLKYSWNSGYTYFNDAGNIDYDYTIDPPEGTPQGSGVKTDGGDYNFTPSVGMDAGWKLDFGLKYSLGNQDYNISGLPFNYDAQEKEPQSDSTGQSGQQPGTDNSTDRYELYYPSTFHRAFDMLDCGASATNIGRYIGSQYKNKNTTVPGWFAAARETFALLDDYDFYEDYIYPDEFGIAVAQAVLAAGGSPRDAAIMGGRAAASSGGSIRDVRAAMFSAYLPPQGYGFGAENAQSWNDNAWGRPGFTPCPPLKFRFDSAIIKQEPPSNYHIMQHQFKYKFDDNFTSQNLNIGFRYDGKDPEIPDYDPLPDDIPTDTWGVIAPRISLAYDITGDGKNVVKLSAGQYFSQPETFTGWTIGSNWLDEELGVDVNRSNSQIQHIPTGLFVSSVSENNLQRDPQETTVVPNDPLYQVNKQSLVGKIAKKSFGLLLGVVGIETTDWPADYQWGHHAIGLTPRGEDSAWDIYDGSDPNVIVAVIDSGSDLQHPDGPAFNWINEDEIADNNIDDDNNGYVDDIHGWNFLNETNDIQDDFGHGAFVAGIIAAKVNNSIGIAGVNPGARIMTLKVANENGISKSLSIYRAIRYAVDNGAKVINISLGKEGLTELEEIGVNYAWNMGCLVVIAAGNQGSIVSQYGPPGASRSFSVASANVDESRRSSSNKGKTVTMAAPGESIYSISSTTGNKNGVIMPTSDTEYHRLNGTSFAAPYVAGAASLVWAKYPELSNRQLANLLLYTAKDLEDPGWDIETGAGMVNVREAMLKGAEPVPGLRISDFIFLEEKGSLRWIDIYGVVDGPVEEYTIHYAKGYDPDEDDYREICEPAQVQVDHGLLCRVNKKKLKGSKWTFKLSAKLSNGTSRHVSMGVNNKGEIQK